MLHIFLPAEQRNKSHNSRNTVQHYLFPSRSCCRITKRWAVSVQAPLESTGFTFVSPLASTPPVSLFVHANQ